MTRPLVLVTRPAGEADPLVAALRSRGYRALAVPTVVTHEQAPGGPLDDALADPVGWDWILVTSATGAVAVGHALARTGPLPDRTAGAAGAARASGTAEPEHPTRWAALGPATAAALEAIGIAVDVVPVHASGAGLARELIGQWDVRGRRILLARADAASSDLPTALRAAGALVHEAVAYHTVEAPPQSAGGIRDALADPSLVAAIAASASAVRGLLTLASRTGSSERMLALPLISIGPSTSEAARNLGFGAVLESDQPSVDGLLAVLATILDAPSPTPAGSGRTT